MSALPLRATPVRCLTDLAGQPERTTGWVIANVTLPLHCRWIGTGAQDLDDWRRYLHGALLPHVHAARWNTLTLAAMRGWSLDEMLAFDESTLVGTLTPDAAWDGTLGSGFTSPPSEGGNVNGASGTYLDSITNLKVYLRDKITVVNDETITVRVGAFHPAGIERVDFYFENDTPVSVTAMSAEPDTNIPSFVATFTPGSVSGEANLYVVAVPKHGVISQEGPFSILVESASDPTNPVAPRFVDTAIGNNANDALDNVGFTALDAAYDSTTRTLTTTLGDFSNASDAATHPRFVYLVSGTGLTANGPFIIETYNSATSVVLAPQATQDELNWGRTLPTGTPTAITTATGPRLSVPHAQATVAASVKNLRIYCSAATNHYTRFSAASSNANSTNGYEVRVERCPTPASLPGLAGFTRDDVIFSVFESALGNWIPRGAPLTWLDVSFDRLVPRNGQTGDEQNFVGAKHYDSTFAGDFEADELPFAAAYLSGTTKTCDGCAYDKVREPVDGAEWIWGGTATNYQGDIAQNTTHVYGMRPSIGWIFGVSIHPDFIQVSLPSTGGGYFAQWCFNQCWNQFRKFLFTSNDQVPANTDGYMTAAIVGNLHDNTIGNRTSVQSASTNPMLDCILSHNTYLAILTFDDDAIAGGPWDNAVLRSRIAHNVFYQVNESTGAGVLSDPEMEIGRNHFMTGSAFGTNATTGGVDAELFMNVPTGDYTPRTGGDLAGVLTDVSHATFPDINGHAIAVGGNIGAIQSDISLAELETVAPYRRAAKNRSATRRGA